MPVAPSTSLRGFLMGVYTRSGSLIAAEARDRDDMRRHAAASRGERWEAEVRRAVMAGFTDREAPFAAMARMVRGPATVAVVRRHLQATHPELYEVAA
jgi:hypothetical protein